MRKERPQSRKVRPRTKIERSTSRACRHAHMTSEEAVRSDRECGPARRRRAPMRGRANACVRGSTNAFVRGSANELV